jgi:hypothetical protein
MARRSKGKRQPGSTPKSGRRRSRYSAGELFMAGVGVLLLILFAGIIVTSIFD